MTAGTRKRADGGASTSMVNTNVSLEFRTRYLEPEELAVRSWMGKRQCSSFLDVGAGDGRFSRMALELGAGRVVALDIDEDCIGELRQLRQCIAGAEKRLEIVHADIRTYDIRDGSFQTVMLLGNTFSGFYDSWEGGERSTQAEMLGRLMRASSGYVLLSLQRPESFDLFRRFYEANRWDFYGYDEESGVKRLRWRMKDGRDLEIRSQHFRKEQIERILSDAGVPRGSFSIEPINDINWLVEIRSG
ncbi:MAG: methyltransferase domain-containing protein [Candidatus Micrarchaeia archaeon]